MQGLSIYWILYLVGPCLVVTGCANPAPIVDPATITLSKAMSDTVDALADAEEQGKLRHTDYKLYACTVTAVYNVNASQTIDDKLSLGVTGGPPAAIAPVAVSINESNENTRSGTRGNTITVLLARPECFPKPILTASPSGQIKSKKKKQTPVNNSPISGRPVFRPQ